MQDYLRFNVFLADINNERPAKSALYRDNFASLERLVLVRFSEDYTVVPRDSAWFAFYDGGKLQRMEDTALYQVWEPSPPNVLQTFCMCKSAHLRLNDGILHHSALHGTV